MSDKYTNIWRFTPTTSADASSTSSAANPSDPSPPAAAEHTKPPKPAKKKGGKKHKAKKQSMQARDEERVRVLAAKAKVKEQAREEEERKERESRRAMRGLVSVAAESLVDGQLQDLFEMLGDNQRRIWALAANEAKATVDLDSFVALFDERRPLLERIQSFWGRALAGHRAIQPLFRPADVRLLAFLADLRVDPLGAHTRTLSFAFLANPYLANESVVVSVSPSGVDLLTPLAWKEAGAVFVEEGYEGVVGDFVRPGTERAAGFFQAVAFQVYPWAWSLFMAEAPDWCDGEMGVEETLSGLEGMGLEKVGIVGAAVETEAVSGEGGQGHES